MSDAPKTEAQKTARLRLVSKVIVVATAVFWAIWDVIPAVHHGRGDTISENIRDWSREWWVIPVIWGCLTTHFFVNVGQPDGYKAMFLTLAGILVAALIANAVSVYSFHWQAPVWFRAASLILGCMLGIVLWRQNP